MTEDERLYMFVLLVKSCFDYCAEFRNITTDEAQALILHRIEAREFETDVLDDIRWGLPGIDDVTEGRSEPDERSEGDDDER
jgi:hypothetical protein